MAINNKMSHSISTPAVEATLPSKRKRGAPSPGEEPISKCSRRADSTEELVDRVAGELLDALQPEEESSTQFLRHFITRLVPQEGGLDYEQLSLIKKLVNGALGVFFNDEEHDQIVRIFDKLETSEAFVQSILIAPPVAEDLHFLVHWDHNRKEEDHLPKHCVSRALLLSLLSSVFQYDEQNCYAIAALNYYQRQYPRELVNFLKKVLRKGCFEFRGQKLSAGSLFEIYGGIKEEQNTALQELLLKIFEFAAQNATKDLERVRAFFPELKSKIYFVTSDEGRGHAIAELQEGSTELEFCMQKRVTNKVREIFEPKIDGRKKVAAYEIHPLGGNPRDILKENLLGLPPMDFQKTSLSEFMKSGCKEISFLQYAQHVSLLDPAEVGGYSSDDQQRIDRVERQLYSSKQLEYVLRQFLDEDTAQRYASALPREGMLLRDFADLIKGVEAASSIVNRVVFSVEREVFAGHFPSASLRRREAYFSSLSAARTIQTAYLAKNLGHYSLAQLHNVVLDLLQLPRVVHVGSVHWNRGGAVVNLVSSYNFFDRKRCYYYECLGDPPVMPSRGGVDFPVVVITPRIRLH